VREAAALAGCPARLVDDDRHLSVRADTAGAVQPASGGPRPEWMLAPLPGVPTGRMWLERSGPGGLVESMVLERAAAAAAATLRARPAADGRADAEIVVDATVPEPERLRSAHRLGLPPDGLSRAVAVHGAAPHLEPATPGAPPGEAAAPAPGGPSRAGIGPAVPVVNLPSSWADARTALRFTADGTELDPGPRVVAYEDLGGLALLAAAVGPTTRPAPDVRSIAQIAATTPWALATLVAAAEADTLRSAASRLRVHHSTLQYRLATIERQLGWTVRDPNGRLRLHVALVLRRLHQNPA
jgi:hypothetical protein